MFHRVIFQTVNFINKATSKVANLKKLTTHKQNSRAMAMALAGRPDYSVYGLLTFGAPEPGRSEIRNSESRK